MRGYKVGDTVASNKSGRRAAFIGKITFIGLNGKNESYYHVVDAEGIEWHRDALELSPLYANDNALAAPTLVGAA